jgi:hypothetical protein
MATLLKKLMIFALGLVTVTISTLTCWSYRQPVQWDLSNNGVDWRCLHICDGAACLIYVDADTAPRLKAASPPPAYLKDLRFWRGLSMTMPKARAQMDRVTYESTRAEFEKLLSKYEQVDRLSMAGKANQVCKSKSFAGFFIGVDSSPLEVVLRIPLAALVLLFGLLPTMSFIGWLRFRARRKRENLCLQCGYCLTGNLSGTCPECGTIFAEFR